MECQTTQEIYSFITTNSFTRDNLNSKGGTVKNIHYGDIHTKYSTLFDIRKETVPYINCDISLQRIKTDCFCKEGDLIFADASEDLDGIGKSIEIVNLNNELLLSGLHTLLARPKNSKLIIGFGGHLFMSNSIRTQIQKEAQGAKVLGISAPRLSNILIYYPESKIEQKKIADCLSSLDELISNNILKLKTLKSHKKGLLQQLFPAEGETEPELRFPEFKNSEKWKETALRKIAKYENGKAHEQDIVKIGNFIVVNSKFISSEGNVVKYTKSPVCLAEVGDILMVLSDLPNGKALAKCFYVDSSNRYTVNQRICRITPTKIDSILLYYLLNRNRYFLNFDDGVKQTNLKKEDILNCPILLPQNPAEQQKIANLLSSIDTLIEAQTRKIKALRKHQKGLMQQLFPRSIK